MSETERPAEIQWVVSTSPHVRARETTARIMWSVVAALIPAGLWSVYIFGWHALHVMMLCIFTAIVTEYAIQRLRGRPVTLSDGSAVVTGLLLAYVLPSHTVVVHALRGGVTYTELGAMKWYVPVVGAFVAIAIAKHCFGGLGHNIWNPALVGRAFVQISFPKLVSPAAWPWPLGGTPHVMSAATPLASSAEATYSVKDLFFGYCPGSLGEISALLLLIGALYLMIRRYVDWRLPLGYVAALVALATALAWSPDTSRAGFLRGWPVFAGWQAFSGGVILGAFFMATDMVTSPLSGRGQLVFGIGCGVLTALIRRFGSLPEGVCYAILLMNTVRPYIDRYTRPRVLGEGRE